MNPKIICLLFVLMVGNLNCYSQNVIEDMKQIAQLPEKWVEDIEWAKSEGLYYYVGKNGLIVHFMPNNSDDWRFDKKLKMWNRNNVGKFDSVLVSNWEWIFQDKKMKRIYWEIILINQYLENSNSKSLNIEQQAKSLLSLYQNAYGLLVNNYGKEDINDDYKISGNISDFTAFGIIADLAIIDRVWNIRKSDSLYNSKVRLLWNEDGIMLNISAESILTDI